MEFPAVPRMWSRGERRLAVTQAIAAVGLTLGRRSLTRDVARGGAVQPRSGGG